MIYPEPVFKWQSLHLNPRFQHQSLQSNQIVCYWPRSVHIQSPCPCAVPEDCLNHLSNQSDYFLALSPSRLLHRLSARILPFSFQYLYSFQKHFFFQRQLSLLLIKSNLFCLAHWPFKVYPLSQPHRPFPHHHPPTACTGAEQSSVQFSEPLLTPVPFFAHLVSSPWNPPFFFF